MKTIIELIAEANELKKRAGELQSALQEIEEAQNAPKNLVDMGKLMKRVAASKITGHILTEKNDPIVSEAYLTLLISLANTNAPTKGLNSSLEYPCRIAAALSSPPDMDLLLKKSLILDKTAIAEYISILDGKSVTQAFVIDALLMIAIYDKGNAGKLDYLTDLIALLAISQECLAELLLILDAVLQKKEKFVANFDYADINQVWFYIYNSCKNIIIDSVDMFVATYEELTDATEDFKTIKELSNKNSVIINNAYIHDVEWSLTVKNVPELKIEDCQFANIKNRLMSYENVESVEITNCKFSSILCSYYDMGGKTDYRHKPCGIIAYFEKVKNVTISDTDFSYCTVKIAYNYIDREVQSFGKHEESPGRDVLFMGIDSANFHEVNCRRLGTCSNMLDGNSNSGIVWWFS